MSVRVFEVQHAGSASPLVAQLVRARRLWWIVALVRAAVVSLAVGCLWVPWTWARVLFSGSVGAPPWFDLAAQVAAVAAVAAVLALGYVVGQAPSLLVLARRADRVLDQAQRLSTALEVRSRDAARGTVERALLADADARAGQLDWRFVASAGWPRWASAAIVVSLLVAALGLGFEMPDGQRRVGPTHAASARVELTSAEVAAVQGFSDLLTEIAAAEESAYLRAVATSFEELALQMADGSMDAAGASRALAELVAHLQVASTEVSSAFAEAVSASLASLVPGATPDLAAAGDGGGDSNRGGDDARDGESASGAPETPVAPGADAVGSAPASYYTALQDLAGEIRDSAGGLGLRSQRTQSADGGALDESTFYGGVLNAETDPNAASLQAGARIDAPGAGVAVGAAEQSSDRAGDAAGEGSAVLGGDRGFLDLDAESVASTPLPWNERDDGRFVEVELVPDTVVGEARAFERPVSAGAFRRMDESPTVSYTIAETYGDVVARYFLPRVARSGATP